MGLIAAVFAVAGATLFGKSNNEDSSANLRLDAAFIVLIGSTCRLEQEVASGNLVAGKNLFWEEVHITSHALSGELAGANVAQQAKLLEAKSRVEVGFATLAPSLKTDVPLLGNEIRAGLRAVAVPGAERTC